MPELKSERHHWWPECVSEHWKGTDGCVTWVSPDGKERRAPPKNFGVIGNGHHVKLGRGKPTVWDHSFEAQFQKADDNFPAVIAWLDGLERDWVADANSRRDRFLAQPASDDIVSLLVECIVSLAVRSPRFRERAVAVAEHLRGPLPEQERNSLIAMNMRNSQRVVADSIRVHGKFAVLFSPKREFIFGDGFYSTLTAPADAPNSPKMLVPITPHISVLYARPNSYGTNPKLVTMVVSDDEAKGLNDAVQVYAKDFIFYRSEKPELTEPFQQRQHLMYADPAHPIERLIDAIPGVPPRNKALDNLIRRSPRR